jgi:small ligand-binding sensory domain FIST
MDFLSAHATHPRWAVAVSLVTAPLRAQLDARLAAAQAPDASPGDAHAPTGRSLPSLGLVYVTDALADHVQDMLDQLMAVLPEVSDWVGTVAVGVVASGVEYWNEPAVSVMLLDLPSDQYRVFSGVQPLPRAWPGGDGLPVVPQTAWVHADPATPDLAELVGELASRTRTGTVWGGLSSGRTGAVQVAHGSQGVPPGQGAPSGVMRGGLSGVAWGAGVAWQAGVTQGCQPVGPSRRVTSAEGGVILTLDDQPALDALLIDLGAAAETGLPLRLLRETLTAVEPEAVADRAWHRRHGALSVQARVRHLVGLDPARRALVSSDAVQVGERLTFCRRHAEVAKADLMALCASVREGLESPDADDSAGPTSPQRIVGALYASCVGRGGPHFGQPHAEMQAVRRALGDVPLAGFFAAGELAGQQLMGYSGVLVVFTEAVASHPPG